MLTTTLSFLPTLYGRSSTGQMQVLIRLMYTKKYPWEDSAVAAAGRENTMVFNRMSCFWWCTCFGMVVAGAGCHSPEKTSGSPEMTKFYHRWLAKNVHVEIQRAIVDHGSGLYQVDAHVVAAALEPGRSDGYRIAARTVFYRGGRQNVVDTSAWSELLIDPGRPVVYTSTSLQPADDCLIEVGYPEEVGLQ